jgi:hypothetical protein
MLRFEPGISEQLSSGWALGWVKPDAANEIKAAVECSAWW